MQLLSTADAFINRLSRARLCLALFALAALPRALYLIVARPAFEGYHSIAADALLRTGSFGDETARWTEYDPVYPVFLASVQWLFGPTALLIQAVQIAVDSAGAIGLYLLAESLTGRRRPAVIGAALYAFYPLLIRYSVLGSELSLLSVLLIAFACTVVADATPYRAAIAGFCLGLAVLTRSMVAPVALLTAAVFALTRGVTTAICFVLAVTATVSPWLIRNYTVNGSIWPAKSGLNLFMGNSKYMDAVLPEHNIDLIAAYAIDLVARSRPDLLHPAAEAALDRYYTALTWNEVKARPRQALGLVLSKGAYFFWPRLIPMRIRLPDTRIELLDDGRIRVENSPPRGIFEEIAYTVSYTFIAATALVGIWIRRSSLVQDAPLWCIVFTFAAIAAIYFPATRYRAPMEFVLLFYAAVALDAITRHGQGKPCR